jgi:hypothetical protein
VLAVATASKVLRDGLDATWKVGPQADAVEIRFAQMSRNTRSKTAPIGYGFDRAAHAV